MTEFTFDYCKGIHLGFKKYKGQTIDQVAQTDEGLKYLDWLGSQPWLDVVTSKAIRVYLSDPSISKELKNALDD